MTLHKLHAGDGYTYLTRQVAAGDVNRTPGQALADYYTASGTPPGRWMGAGAADLGIDGVVREDQMKALFGRGMHPDADQIIALERAAGSDPATVAKAVKLGRAFPTYDKLLPRADRVAVMVARHEAEHGTSPSLAEVSKIEMREARKERKAVAGYDLVFSPVKSASILWALGDARTRQAVEDAHHEAVANTIGWLEQHTCFARLGQGGTEQVRARGFVAVAFDHHDSRAGDPDLHTHVAIANKVRTLDDGPDGGARWLSLDARPLHAAGVAASERYNTRLEDGLRHRLGVTFVERRDTIRADKRVVREIAGVPDTLITHFSKRRTDIEDRMIELEADYADRHGHAPRVGAAVALAEQATLETRGLKRTGTPLAVKLARWRDEAGTLEGRGTLRIEQQSSRQSDSPDPLEASDVNALARTVLDRLATDKATWTWWNVTAETERQLRPHALPSDALREELTRQVVARACDPSKSVQLTSDAAGVGTQRYSVRATLDAEQRLLDATTQPVHEAIAAQSVDLRLAAHQHRTGRDLDDGQRELVKAFALSTRLLAVGIGAAGTGKTSAMAALVDVWQNELSRRIIPLATTARAAAVLQSEVGVRVENVHQFQHAIQRDTHDDWYRLRRGDLILVDEASMVSTRQLDWLVDHASMHGARVRLLGDPAQLASVEAGGAFGLLAARSPITDLTTLYRFADPREAEATQKLRGGDVTGLDYYFDRRRVRSGPPRALTERLLAAWHTDVNNGHRSLMLCGSNREVAALNARAQTVLHRTNHPASSAGLADGNRAAAGDVIMTRRNDVRTRLDGSRMTVHNGDLWGVRRRLPNGDLLVQSDDGRSIRLTAKYLSAHAQLGYACSIAVSQGTTVDTCHVVVSPGMTRESLYVAASRARLETALYVAHHSRPLTASEPQTPRDVLATVITRSGCERSALEVADARRLPPADRQGRVQPRGVVNRQAPSTR